MNKEQLIRFRKWFDDFVAGFYCDDEFINANIKMKEDHSRRVCGEMIYLAKELKLEGNRRLLAETIALFHDVGRFPQFKQYRTYNDNRSTNHCLLGLETLKNENILSILSDEDKKLIEISIRYHGEKQVPDNLSGDAQFFTKMIRDADKLDIYRVFTNAYIQYRDDPEHYKLEIEFPDIPEISDEILDAVLSGRLIDGKLLKSWHDMKLCVIGWVYDINFNASLKRIKQKKYIETLLDFLPDTADIRKVCEKIFSYIESRLKQAS
jgi:hypothetical protein